MRVVWPTLFMRLAFHDGSQLAMASTSGNRSAFLRVNTESGTPRYLQGKRTTWAGKQLCTATTWSLEQCMGVI
jgi:hypothetical protein